MYFILLPVRHSLARRAIKKDKGKKNLTYCENYVMKKEKEKNKMYLYSIVAFYFFLTYKLLLLTHFFVVLEF